MHRPGSARGFTLVELLVVITIIVILLALLTPALDKAISEAEMAVCASQTRNIAMGATSYAFDSKRYYPDRGGVTNPPSYPLGSQPVDLAFIGGGSTSFDDRPKLRNYIAMGARGQLNCPLSGKIDIDSSDDDAWTMSPYALYFGWSFVHPEGWSATNSGNGGRRLPGMTRLGNRMEWKIGNVTYFFDVLACDDDLFTTGNGYSTHPNDKGVWENQVLQNEGVTFMGSGYKATLSRWTGSGPDRGLLDLNFAMADGSVTRINRVDVDPYSANTTAKGKIVPVPYISMTPSLVFYRHLPAAR